MMFLTIEATETAVIVKFNALEDHEDVNAYEAEFKRSAIMQLFHYKNPELISITMWDGHVWQLNLDGKNGGHPVTSVNLGGGDVFPTTMNELKLLLKQLMI